jgi:hypothetical protein
MRIRTHYYNDFGTYPCSNTDFGEVEDYTIEIKDVSPVVWTGSIDSLWNKAGNWDTGSIPDITSDVTIPSSVTVLPYISAGDTVQCNSLKLETGTKITVDGKISIYGKQ